MKVGIFKWNGLNIFKLKIYKHTTNENSKIIKFIIKYLELTFISIKYSKWPSKVSSLQALKQNN
jgi:hypothetical protein